MSSFLRGLNKDKLRKKIPNEIVNNFYHLPKSLGAVLWNFYPAREMIVIGVTGTSGKTTTCNLIYHILKHGGLPVSLISTIKAVIGDKEYDTGLHVTSPEPFLLQRLIKQSHDAGSKYLVLEVTSHGLDQFRNLGSHIGIGVITNISHEHLDYHKTMKNYILAKAKILKGVKYSILNRDDKNFQVLKNISEGRLITFALKKKADFTPKSFPFRTKLYGEFNKYNCLAAVAVTKMLGLEDDVIRKGLASFSSPPGRMEEVNTGKKFRVFIDFAHKPNALENILKTAKSLSKKRIIVMFGAAGLRDQTKRPIMGEISGRLADISVITAEDPRTENLRKIISQICRGFLKSGAEEFTARNLNKINKYNNKHYFIRIPDRKQAIKFILRRIVKKGDIVLFCGKGHEKSMCFGKIEYPWNEKDEILKAVAK